MRKVMRNRGARKRNDVMRILKDAAQARL